MLCNIYIILNSLEKNKKETIFVKNYNIYGNSGLFYIKTMDFLKYQNRKFHPYPLINHMLGQKIVTMNTSRGSVMKKNIRMEDM